MRQPAPRREKRQSGKSWRDYEIDDEFGEWDDGGEPEAEASSEAE